MDRLVTRPATAVSLCLLAICCGGATDDATSESSAPRRVAVMAPAAAEMLEELRLLDRVVGIGDYGPWPRAIADRPSLGRYDAPNVEAVLSLRVDLLLTAASEAGAATHRRLETLGVRVIALDTSTYRGIFDSLEQVGQAFGRKADAAAAAERLRRSMREIEKRGAVASPRRVLFVVGRDPLFVAGPGSHVDEMIRMVGGRNVADDALAPYQQVSLEAILERMPEVIIDSSDNRPGALRGRTPGSWGRWEFLPAVREDRVYWVDPGRLVIPGLRLPEMTMLMGKLIQPGVFGEATFSELE